jgi:hypothetical protein
MLMACLGRASGVVIVVLAMLFLGFCSLGAR